MDRATPEQRFAERAVMNPATGCLEWTGWLSRGGYAQFRVGGRKVYVHRWAWEQENGPIPSGLFLDHLCRNRRCANTAHLEVVTGRENTLRGVSFSAVNAIKTHCPYGHAYTPENTYTNPRGSRVCRECKTARNRQDKANQRRYRLREKASA